MFVTQLLNFILHVLCPRFDLFSVPFWQYLEKKQIPVSEVEIWIEIEKGKSNKSKIFFLDLSSHFPHKIKDIEKKENKSLEVTNSGNIWHFYIHFKVLTQFFLITITVFNKNANLKKKEKEKSHLDIGQPLIIKYVLVRALI